MNNERFVLRHWRGNGQIIPDKMKELYHDYPKHRRIRPYKLSECFYKEISLNEYLEKILQMYGQAEYDKQLLKYNKQI